MRFSSDFKLIDSFSRFSEMNWEKYDGKVRSHKLASVFEGMVRDGDKH